MPPLQIPKRKVSATIQLQHGPLLRGHLFVETLTATHSGSQTVSEYLELPGAFLPFESEQEFLFLAKDSIAVVRVSEEDEAGEAWSELPLLPVDEEDAAPEVRVRVELRGGSVVEGEVVSAMPPEHCRLMDYLNQERRFLVLRAREDLAIINKVFIAVARPLKDL